MNQAEEGHLRVIHGSTSRRPAATATVAALGASPCGPASLALTAWSASVRLPPMAAARPVSPLILDRLLRPEFLLKTFGSSPGTPAWEPGFPPLRRHSRLPFSGLQGAPDDRTIFTQKAGKAIGSGSITYRFVPIERFTFN
jgi:hypothetical protein